MSEISRRAGEKIKRWGRKVDALTAPPPGTVPAENVPILLMRAQEEIVSGETGISHRLVRSSLDDSKGTEQELPDDLQVFNRFADLSIGDEFFARWIDGGYERISGSSSTTSTTGEGCGGCNEPAGNLIIDLGGGLICSDRYYFSPMCDALLPITFDYDTGSDWDGGPGTLSVSCTDDGTVTVTATLTISGTAVGDVTITISDGTNTWTWQNDTAFTPSLPVAMRRMTGPVDCPCSTWRPYPCLTPLDAA